MYDALVDTYTSVFEIRQMVLHRMGDPLTRIAENVSRDAQAERVISWAESRGRILELVQAVLADRARNPKVESLRESLAGLPLASGDMRQRIVALESTALQLAEAIGGDDARWEAAAQRLYPTGDTPSNARPREAIHILASLSRGERAGTLTTALLLRMADACDADRSGIEKGLARYVVAADDVNRNVFGGRQAYVIAMAYSTDGVLIATHLWFYGGRDGDPAKALRWPDEGGTLEAAFNTVFDHMSENCAENAAIELATPLDVLLDSNDVGFRCAGEFR